MQTSPNWPSVPHNMSEDKLVPPRRDYLATLSLCALRLLRQQVQRLRRALQLLRAPARVK